MIARCVIGKDSQKQVQNCLRLLLPNSTKITGKGHFLINITEKLALAARLKFLTAHFDQDVGTGEPS